MLYFCWLHIFVTYLRLKISGWEKAWWKRWQLLIVVGYRASKRLASGYLINKGNIFLQWCSSLKCSRDSCPIWVEINTAGLALRHPVKGWAQHGTFSQRPGHQTGIQQPAALSLWICSASLTWTRRAGMWLDCSMCYVRLTYLPRHCYPSLY